MLTDPARFDGDVARCGIGIDEDLLADDQVMDELLPFLRAEMALADGYRNREGEPLQARSPRSTVCTI